MKSHKVKIIIAAGVLCLVLFAIVLNTGGFLANKQTIAANNSNNETCSVPAGDEEQTGEDGTLSSFFLGDSTYELNGTVKEMDKAPYLNDESIFVSLRYLASALLIQDRNIVTDGTNISLTKKYTTVKLSLGSDEVLINGKTDEIPTAPEISSDNIIMVPVKEVAEALGAKVDYDAATKKVAVFMPYTTGYIPPS